MRDIIDKRDEQERISRSIVKFWNVNYIPAHAADERWGFRRWSRSLRVRTLPENRDRAQL